MAKFDFKKTDLILIGQDGCVDDAFASAVAVKASVFILFSRTDWERNYEGPRLDSAFALAFCGRNTIESTNNFQNLINQRQPQRVFLAGRVPSQTHLKLDTVKLIAQGTHNSVARDHALAIKCEKSELTPCSLASVAYDFASNALEPITEQGNRELQSALAQIVARKEKRGTSNADMRDLTAQALGSAIMLETIAGRSEAVALSCAQNVFDTPYLDPVLLESLHTKLGISRLYMDNEVALLNAETVQAKADMLGVELTALPR